MKQLQRSLIWETMISPGQEFYEPMFLRSGCQLFASLLQHCPNSGGIFASLQERSQKGSNLPGRQLASHVTPPRGSEPLRGRVSGIWTKPAQAQHLTVLLDLRGLPATSLLGLGHGS